MKPLFICYEKCSTCQKAKKWLLANGVDFDERPIKEQNPTVEELRAWLGRSGLPLNRLFNTSGMQYRALGLKDRLPVMREEETLALLASDGMLVKRPVLVTEGAVCFGFREDAWREALGL
ncbi:MAG: arsenate reductase family protein [Clostridia bacterium]|nr:arsenate reductase family protein [Clostridia bacterium]